MRRQYLSAPLPFQGQKRMFAKEFIKVLKHYQDDAVFVDLFGGSGLLSHITKCQKPDATVVYNDFDNYRRRLENIPRTNALLDKIREVVASVPRRKILPEKNKRSHPAPDRTGRKRTWLRGLYHAFDLPALFHEVCH